MLDLDKLEAEREKAEGDKVDLFDFYQANWATVIAELAELQRLRAFDQWNRGFDAEGAQKLLDEAKQKKAQGDKEIRSAYEGFDR